MGSAPSMIATRLVIAYAKGMEAYYIVPGESSGFALTTPDLGIGGHTIDGFPSEQAAQDFLDSRRAALNWAAARRAINEHSDDPRRHRAWWLGSEGR